MRITRSGIGALVGSYALITGARTAGLDWLVVLGAGGLVVVVADGVLSWWALRRVEVRTDAPRDAMVGRAHVVRVHVVRPHGRVWLRTLGSADSPWTWVDAPASGDLLVTPVARGVFGHAGYSLLVNAPFGLVSVARQVVVAMSTPVSVAPRPIPTPLPAPRLAAPGERGRPGGSAVAQPRGVREYVAGDPRRLVHWPTTARAGQLMVKVLDGQVADDVVLVADLGAEPGEAAEQRAGRAMAMAVDLLRRGDRVVLVTRERAGERRGAVRTPGEVGRRLAAAVPGPALEVPEGALAVPDAGGPR